MTEREKIVVGFVENCIERAPSWNVCPKKFAVLREEILAIMAERDEDKKQLERMYMQIER